MDLTKNYNGRWGSKANFEGSFIWEMCMARLPQLRSGRIGTPVQWVWRDRKK